MSMPAPPEGYEWHVNLNIFGPHVWLDPVGSPEGRLQFHAGADSASVKDIVRSAEKLLGSRDDAMARYAARQAEQQALSEALGCRVNYE